jgi:hypothetical protein
VGRKTIKASINQSVNQSIHQPIYQITGSAEVVQMDDCITKFPKLDEVYRNMPKLSECKALMTATLRH